MRIAFVGAVEFSRVCLDTLLALGADIVGVVTITEELVPFHTDYVDLEPMADAHRIPFLRVRNVNDPVALEWLQTVRPDILFVFGWSQILRSDALHLAPLGAIGTHPGLLPHVRGRNVIQWAIALGHERTGLTFFWLDEGTDTGDVLWQESFEIEREDDAATVYAKLQDAARRGIHEFFPRLLAGTAPRVPQDHSKAGYFRRRNDDDRLIRWASSTLDIYNLVRAIARPYVGAQALLDGHEVLVWRARLPEGPLPVGAANAPPGTVIGRDAAGLHVRTGDGFITLVDVEPASFATLQPGAQFEAVA